jgi:hypothetical protein
MRLLCFLAAIAVLFCLSDANAAETAFAASVASAGPLERPSAQQAGLRLLTWPGKVEPAQAARPHAASRTWTARSYSGVVSRQVEAQPAPVAAARPRAGRAWDPVAGVALDSPPAKAPPPPSALPTSIYDAPPPLAQPAPAAPRVLAQAQPPASANDTSDYQPTHFYSVHRQYGQAPDPIPLDAQFFATSSPDLAQPPPAAPRTFTTSTGRVIQAAPPSLDDVPG